VAALFGTPVDAAPEPELPPAPSRAADPLPVAAVASPSSAPAAMMPAQPSGPRRIVVDASAQRERESAAPEAGGEDDGGDHTGATGGESGRIPAPDPSAFSGGGRRGRRSRRR
jgi:hypothetical protein